jgi:hypothetical protein
MAKYTVYLTTVASTSVEVEADDPGDALEKADSSYMPQICAQCSGWGKNFSLELGDEWAPTDVYDSDDNLVWEDRPKPTED